MAVKYVKDFSFDSGFGFSGSSGKTPVRAYMRGGAVKSNPTKAPSIAPAMVEKRSQGLGGLTKETKKLAPYNKPHMEGKKGAKVATYAKGGAVKKAHAKKEMPSFLKAKMMKKAEGGPVAEIMPGDGMSPLQAMALPEASMYDAPMPEDEGHIIEERMLPSLPPGYEPPPLGGDLRDLVMSTMPIPVKAPEPEYPVGPKRPSYLDLPPVGALTPLPEEPIYVTAFDGPNIAEEDPNRYREMIADMQRATQQPQYLEPLPPLDVFGRSGLNKGPAAFELPAPRTRADIADARRAAMSERAGMREDMARPRGLGRAVMRARDKIASRMKTPTPVNRLLQPYMPTYDFSQEPIPAGFVASPEARYANGGMVENFTTGQGMNEAAFSDSRRAAGLGNFTTGQGMNEAAFSDSRRAAGLGNFTTGQGMDEAAFSNARRGMPTPVRRAPVASAAEAKAQTAVAKQRLADMQARAAQVRAANEAKRAASASKLAASRAKLSPATRAASEKFQSDLRAKALANAAARKRVPVAPRKPMIQIPRAPQGGIATFAKGGKVSKGEKKIGKVMGEFKRGELHSGSKKGPIVTNPKQATAIALSEARAAGAKIPKKKAMGGKACG